MVYRTIISPLWHPLDYSHQRFFNSCLLSWFSTTFYQNTGTLHPFTNNPFFVDEWLFCSIRPQFLSPPFLPLVSAVHLDQFILFTSVALYLVFAASRLLESDHDLGILHLLLTSLFTDERGLRRERNLGENEHRRDLFILCYCHRGVSQFSSLLSCRIYCGEIVFLPHRPLGS